MVGYLTPSDISGLCKPFFPKSLCQHALCDCYCGGGLALNCARRPPSPLTAPPQWDRGRKGGEKAMGRDKDREIVTGKTDSTWEMYH